MVKTRDLGEDGIIYRPDNFKGEFKDYRRKDNVLPTDKGCMQRKRL